MRPVVAVLIAIVTVGGLLTDVREVTLGQSCIEELEPNDAPEVAASLTAQGCTTGQLPEDDLADHLLWTLPAEATGQRWRIALSSVAGVPAVARVVSVTSEPGAAAVTLGMPVADLRPSADAAEPSVTPDLLLATGRYLIAVTASGPWAGEPTEYRIDIEPGNPLPASGDQEPNDDPTTATAVAEAFELSGDAAGSVDHFAWDVSGDSPGLWTVEAQGPVGTTLWLAVTDAAGTVLGEGFLEADGTVRLPDLALTPGTYGVRVTGTADGSAPYILRAAQEDIQTADPEPNDVAARALDIVSGTLTAGRLARNGDTDVYRLTVDAALGSVLLDVRLITQSGPSRRVCLLRLPGLDVPDDLPRELACDDGERVATLTGLLLEPADYALAISGAPSPPDPYYLRVDVAGQPADGYETEPNDTPPQATPMAADAAMSGHLDDDPDLVRAHVEGEPQLWEVEARGADVRLLWVRSDGAAVGIGADPDGSGERSIVTDAYLIPGDHWFRVDGTGDYTLRLTPLGPPDPDAEREPNDALALAEALPMDGSMTGRIGNAADGDVFGFSLAAPEHVRLTLEPPPDATLSILPGADATALTSGRVITVPGEAVELDLVLPAGDHAVRVVGQADDDRYRLSLRRQDPFDLTADQEPNDQVETARPLSAGVRVEGTVGSADRGDWYALGTLPAPGELTVDTEGRISSLVLHDGVVEMPLTSVDGTTYVSPPLPAGAKVSVGIVADGPYALVVDPGTTGLTVASGDPGGPLPLALSLAMEASEAAAFEVPGQRVGGTLSVTNSGPAPLQLGLDATTSRPDWTVSFGAPEVTVEPGGSVEVPVTVEVPSQAGTDTVRVTVRARDANGQATSFVEITPRDGAALVDPFRSWSVPDELLGGLDAAATGLGAVPMPSIDAAAELTLHDGVVALGGGMDLFTAPPLTLTVDLAGDDPVSVAGTILDPAAGLGGVAGTVRAFELLLSVDGVTYETAMSGSLSGALTEQAFVLAEPVIARYAQLRILSTFPGYEHVKLGEWKVVATPGWQPTADPLDIASAGLGGHIAWVDPQPSSALTLEGMVTGGDTLLEWMPFDRLGTDRVTWVLGFQDTRAAQVTELQWADAPGSNPSLRLDGVELATSLEGPLGPWSPIGTWELERDGSGAVAPYVLEAPTWARYIRMSAPLRDSSTGVLELPGVLRVFEQPASETYRSVAGEWGYVSPAGPYEWQRPLATDAPGGDERDETGLDEGMPLDVGASVGGRVARGEDTDTYAFTVPPDQGLVTFTLSGRPTVGVGITLLGETGAEVPTSLSPGADPGTVDHQAAVTPGERYRVVVEQPPVSVVVAYDTSGSIAQYVPIMAAALRSYVRGVVAGQEALQLVDFEAAPIPDEFTDDPWLILNALDAHAGAQTGSSSVEIGLLNAVDVLAQREGARAILLLTDAETASFLSNTEVWRWLSLIRPRIFTVHVGGVSTPVQNERMMQDWAASSAGAYEYARSGSAIADAFERMAAELRRPADYGLVMSLTKDLPTSEPGSVRVVSDPSAQPEPVGDDEPTRARSSPDVAVELVLDTSGSMLERIGRRRRIDVAKDVLARLVTERLAPGTPVALRVFRQDGPGCETELAVPLSPLDPAAMAGTIESLGVRRSVSTPLAAAIEAVASDLAAVAGPRIVVVVSDGEESCDGDPEEAVRALVDQGFDVSVNVVGLDLDRKARRKVERLAEVGNGTYYDARDADELAAALKAAVGAPFVVVDGSGTNVGRGAIDGDAIELPPGTYRIQIVGAADSLDVAVIEPGRRTTIVARRSPR